MTSVLVLDAEAMSALSHRSGPRRHEVRGALHAAERLDRSAIVPAVVLAELYRGPRRDAVVDACLSRETGLQVRDTNRSLARAVGGVLAAADAGSEDIVDAHVVAVAAEADQGVILSGDEGDVTRLAAAYPTVIVQRI